MKKKISATTVYLFLMILLLCGCGGTESVQITTSLKSVPVPVPNLAAANSILSAIDTSASGTAEERTADAIVDYSNVSDGYVMVQYIGNSESRIKAQVKGPSETYSYDITKDVWATFPLSEGNGEYSVKVFENVGGTKYAQLMSASFTAEISDEFAPFLRPNQYVNYADAPNAVAIACGLTEDIDGTLDKVAAVYEYVVHTLSYDKELAETVKTGYLPELDAVLEKGSGICFDYASLMTAMLRSQGIPCKLVVGYAGSAYHAWISVWVDGEGWIDKVVYFDGKTWQRMDPTFASTGGKTAQEFIGDGSNYMEKYFY